MRGFRVPAVAHLLHLLDEGIARELQLGRHGLAMAKESLKTIALSESGQSLVLGADRIERGEVSSADAATYPQFLERMRRLAGVLAEQHGRVPPRLGWTRWRDAWPAARLALDVRRLGREDMQEFLRIVTMPMHDLLEENFESPAIKGALALDAVLGTRLGPRSGNSVFTYLHRLSGRAPSVPRGGVGALSEAVAAAARAAGAEIRVSAPVAAILVADGRVRGVRLENGEEVMASVVVSNADPRTTFGALLGARHLEAEFARRVQHLRTTGTAAKLNLALSGPPAFRGVPAGELGERLVIAPDAGYVDEAFNAAKYRDSSPEPVLEITVPSAADPELAPPGKHVLSAIAQYAPADLAAGWDGHRDAFRDRLLALLERYAPGIRRQVVAAELLTPVDLERQLRMAGGHWHHGELVLDQFLMLRPVPGAAQYAAPVGGLFLCGAGCHPGGGVNGAAGRNAARVVLAEERA
jgi:phytoene dehydrogenase-like protein